MINLSSEGRPGFWKRDHGETLERRREEFGNSMGELEIVGEVKKLFEKKGWDERVPRLIHWWIRNSSYYLAVGLHPEWDIKLCRGTKGRGRPDTEVYTQDSWRVMGYLKQGQESQLKFEGYPVTSVQVITSGEDEHFEVSDPGNKIEFAFSNDGFAVRVGISGKMEFIPTETT